jgi:hypothetical protein
MNELHFEHRQSVTTVVGAGTAGRAARLDIEISLLIFCNSIANAPHAKTA